MKEKYLKNKEAARANAILIQERAKKYPCPHLKHGSLSSKASEVLEEYLEGHTFRKLGEKYKVSSMAVCLLINRCYHVHKT